MRARNMHNRWLEQVSANLQQVGGLLLRCKRPYKDGRKNDMSGPSPQIKRPRLSALDP
jgi:hypothetical protein